eukprot:TRINITY_DN3208_c0_g1_i1.p1 TRINITY_DN3208_c0_g1~~TRINITY_DN3208_c0_g1_i1.p1  ORF type:complete len:700 (+),score=68.36 TRINITY_DN3208_c0_g1_i1:105-2204(+)
MLPREPRENDTRGLEGSHELEKYVLTVIANETRRVTDLENRVVALEERFTDPVQVGGRSITDKQVYPSQVSCYFASMHRPEGDVPVVDEPGASSRISGENDVHLEAGHHADVDSEEEYVLAESVWDAVLVVGLPGVSHTASALGILCLLLNILVQAFICCTLLFTSDGFIPENGESRYAPLVGDMERWRLSHGHKVRDLDLNDVNLVSRVCNNDVSLSLGLRQVDILAVINSYVGSKDSVSPVTFVLIGPVVTMVCIFFFCLVVVTELRLVCRLFLALVTLPKTEHTQIDDGAFVSISNKRLACSLFVIVLRMTVACLLLVVGTIWLSLTNDITELLLNTAALSFVLELDDLLFHAMLPVKVQKVLIRMKPLKFSRLPWNLESISAMIFTVSIIAIAYIRIIVNNVDAMLRVRNEICGGFKEFVVEKNSLGFMVARRTENAVDTGAHVYEFQAVQELVQAGNPGSDAEFDLMRWSNKDVAQFEQFVTNAHSMTEVFACVDQDQGPWETEFRTRYRFVFNTMIALVVQGNGTAFSGEFSCGNYRDFCDVSRYPLLRALCPETCGCSESISGLPFSETNLDSGCVPSCNSRVREQIKTAACVDLPVTSTAPRDAVVSSGWRRYWTAVEHVYEEKLGALDGAGYEQYAASDCNFSSATYCSERFKMPRLLKLRSIVAFCPHTCCKGPDPLSRPDECPLACLS